MVASICELTPQTSGTEKERLKYSLEKNTQFWWNISEIDIRNTDCGSVCKRNVVFHWIGELEIIV